MFLGGSKPPASVAVESRPWPVKCQVCVERGRLSTEYRRTVSRYFEWVLGHNRLASVNRHASTAIRMCAKGSALRTSFRRKSHWSMHQISCSKEWGDLSIFYLLPCAHLTCPNRLELSPGRMGWSWNRQNHPWSGRPLWPREIISPRRRHRAPVGGGPPFLRPKGAHAVHLVLDLNLESIGLRSPKQVGLLLGLGLPGPKQIGLLLGLGLPAG
jgi:hypothetical protein